MTTMIPKSFRLPAILLTMVGATLLPAQQIPVFTQYQYDARLYNPATWGAGLVAVQYRKQWLDLDENAAPTTIQAMADLTPWIGLRGHRIGLGLSVNADKAHILSRNGIQINFAYHLVENDNWRLSAGVLAGVLFQNFSFGNTRLGDPNDLALFSGDYKATLFNGGLGLHFSTGKPRGEGLHIDVVAPQLYSSDPSYKGRSNGSQGTSSSFVYDNNAHLLAGIGYRFNVGGIGLEPLFLYRSMIGPKKIKSGRYDFSLRAHFIDNLFWLGAGYRPEASAINVSFGINLTQSRNIGIAAGYETHQVFGGSMEFGAFFEEPKEGPVPEPRLKPTMQSQLDNALGEINAAMGRSKRESAGARQFLNQAQAALGEAQRPGQDDDIAELRLGDASAALQQARSKMQQYEIEKKTVEEQAQLAENATNSGVRLKGAEIKMTQVRTARSEVSTVRNTALKDLERLENSVAEATINLPPKAIGSLVKNGDVERVRKNLQKNLDQLPGKPLNMSPVEVKKNGKLVYMTFVFPNSIEKKFDVNTMEDVQALSGLVAQLVGQLQQNVVIESVQIQASLRSANELRFDVDAEYNSEFGKTSEVKYQLIERSNNSTKAQTVKISGKKLQLEKLVALKLYSIEQYLRQKGLGKTLPVNLLIVTGETAQPFTQMYAITIVAR